MSKDIDELLKLAERANKRLENTEAIAYLIEVARLLSEKENTDE